MNHQSSCGLDTNTVISAVRGYAEKFPRIFYHRHFSASLKETALRGHLMDCNLMNSRLLLSLKECIVEFLGIEVGAVINRLPWPNDACIHQNYNHCGGEQRLAPFNPVRKGYQATSWGISSPDVFMFRLPYQPPPSLGM